MQGVAVVVNRNQRLQGGADVVELNLLGVQRAARGLDVVFEFLAALVGTVFLFQSDSPNAACHAAHDGVLGVHAVAKEETQVGREVVDVHATRQVGLHKCEAIGKREGQLRNRVGTGFGDVIAADGHAVEITHLVIDKILCNVAHHLQ